MSRHLGNHELCSGLVLRSSPNWANEPSEIPFGDTSRLYAMPLLDVDCINQRLAGSSLYLRRGL